MIVICIVAVIVSFIYTFIKVSIDEWLTDLSMKRLALKRDRCEQNTNLSPIEISDDDSYDELSSLRRKIVHNDCKSKTSLNTVNVSSILKDTSNRQPVISAHSSQFVDNIPNDISDDDVTITKTPSTSNGRQSMFNWNKNLTSMPQHISEDNTLLDSECTKETPVEAQNENNLAKPDLINIDDNYDDDNLNNLKREASPPKVTIHHDIMIAGTKVKFPVKPYSSQVAVMNNLITGCKKEENCLIESPTGSGKTLALLCGALAWQTQYCENLTKIVPEKIDGEGLFSKQTEKDDVADVAEILCADEDDSSCSNSYKSDESCDIWSKNKQRIPKIFYLTRTHKQIEQVVRELKKTAYRDKRMTILSSREHTCIQNTKRNKTELCNELLDPEKRNKCPYYNDNKMASFEGARHLGLETPWDIEDLVSLGKSIGACPYFAARSLMADAEIIMCPYNYIASPKIRESMQINLKGHVVIFDEAHNIEDICRDAASVSIKSNKIAKAAEDCEILSKKDLKVNHMYFTIYKYLQDFEKFVNSVDVDENSNDQRGNVSKTWDGIEFLHRLDIDQVGFSRFITFFNASETAIKDFNNSKETQRTPKEMPTSRMPTITLETKMVLEDLCFALKMIMSETDADNYRAYVIETYVVETNEDSPASQKKRENVWILKRHIPQPNTIRILEMVCMNPAVVFTRIANEARSVILASGTLSPISSFESELGTKFLYKLNTNHIIPKEQVYIRCIPQGPNGVVLEANYKNSNSWEFIDELGKLILLVCDAVPYGVLCFFSSYSVMKNMHDRWKDIDIWEKLTKLKEIFKETKDNKDLHKTMAQYREVIKESSSKSFRENSGAILFAVFRGKVAEGIDFSDNEARCVLTVGIPFKNVKDTITVMKKKYNDTNMSTKNLLSGSEWYTTDAFRALNQALGRCIRHINDWGAVLMVDARLQKPNYFGKLPKWIREMKESNTSYNLQVELENFVARQAARERGKMYLEKKKPKGVYKI